MTHHKEEQLATLDKMYQTIGLNKGQWERRAALMREKALEVAHLATQLAEGLTRNNTTTPQAKTPQ